MSRRGKKYRISFMYFAKCEIYRRLWSIFKLKFPDVSSPTAHNSHRTRSATIKTPVKATYHKCTYFFVSNVCCFVRSLIKIIICLQVSVKHRTWKFTKILSIGVALFHEDRRTYLMSLAVAFVKFFVKAPNNCSTK